MLPPADTIEQFVALLKDSTISKVIKIINLS